MIKWVGGRPARKTEPEFSLGLGSNAKLYPYNRRVKSLSCGHLRAKKMRGLRLPTVEPGSPAKRDSWRACDRTCKSFGLAPGTWLLPGSSPAGAALKGGSTVRWLARSARPSERKTNP